MSTIEGNLRLFSEIKSSLAPHASDSTLFNYTLGAYEELRAREVSSRFRLNKIIEQLSKGPLNPLQQANLQGEQTKLENDLALISKTKAYIKNQRRIASTPREMETLRQLRREKAKLSAAEAAIPKLKQRQRTIEDSTPWVADSTELQNISGGTFQATTRELPPEWWKAFEQQEIANRVIRNLKKRIARLAQQLPEASQPLLEEQQRIWKEMRQYAANCTLNPLPPSLQCQSLDIGSAIETAIKNGTTKTIK